MAAPAVKTEAPNPVKPRSTAYHVFKVGPEDTAFTHLTRAGSVTATSRKEAIREAGVNGKQTGPESFLVIAEKEFQVITRKVRQVMEEVFE